MSNQHAPSLYYLGIDTGATKTHALITDQLGKVKVFISGGPGNPQSIGGYHALEKLLANLIIKACKAAGIAISDIHGAGLGLAGYDWPSQLNRFINIARITGLPEQTSLINDSGLGIHAGTTNGWGICVAAGTSFNCRGLGPDGRQAFAIGDGMRWGEGAGALELALKAAQAVIAQYTMRSPETRLTDLFIRTYSAAGLSELVEGIVLGRFRVTAALAPQIIEVARQGDEEAIKAVQWAAESLADLVKGAIRQLGLAAQPVEIVLSGSFFNAGEIINKPLQATVRALAPKATFYTLMLPPVCGGVLMAMNAEGVLDFKKRNAVKKNMQTWFDLHYRSADEKKPIESTRIWDELNKNPTNNFSDSKLP